MCLSKFLFISSLISVLLAFIFAAPLFPLLFCSPHLSLYYSYALSRSSHSLPYLSFQPIATFVTQLHFLFISMVLVVIDLVSLSVFFRCLEVTPSSLCYSVLLASSLLCYSHQYFVLQFSLLPTMDYVPPSSRIRLTI